MTREEILESYPDDEFIFYDGMDDAIIGVAERINLGPVLAYDVDRIIDILMKDGMDETEAIEHYEFNIRGGWLGESTPIFVNTTLL
jgi:hypothetical protein